MSGLFARHLAAGPHAIRGAGFQSKAQKLRKEHCLVEAVSFGGNAGDPGGLVTFRDGTRREGLLVLGTP